MHRKSPPGRFLPNWLGVTVREAGDHTIVILRLHAVEHPDSAQPLVFHRSGFTQLHDGLEVAR